MAISPRIHGIPILKTPELEKEIEVPATSKAVEIELELPAGPAELVTYLYDKNGKAGGAYFTDVERIGD